MERLAHRGKQVSIYRAAALINLGHHLHAGNKLGFLVSGNALIALVIADGTTDLCPIYGLNKPPKIWKALQLSNLTDT